jgi:hypothetical protein
VRSAIAQLFAQSAKNAAAVLSNRGRRELQFGGDHGRAGSGGAGLGTDGATTGYGSFSITLEPPVAMGAMIHIVAQKILER